MTRNIFYKSLLLVTTLLIFTTLAAEAVTMVKEISMYFQYMLFSLKNLFRKICYYQYYLYLYIINNNKQQLKLQTMAKNFQTIHVIKASYSSSRTSSGGRLKISSERFRDEKATSIPFPQEFSNTTDAATAFLTSLGYNILYIADTKSGGGSVWIITDTFKSIREMRLEALKRDKQSRQRF